MMRTMLQFPRWQVDVTVGDRLVKTFNETATTAAAAIGKAKHKMRGAVSNAGAFKFSAKRAEAAGHATKKTPAQLQRDINEVLTRGKRVSGRSPSTKRVAHATKAAKAGKSTSDKITIAQLATMFGLPDWDKIDDLNEQNYWEMSRGAENVEEAESAARDEVFAQWYDAVERTASKLFEEHGLELEPARKTEKRSYDLKIVPYKSWDDAANKIRETINGVGDFHFNDLKEFLRSGPYTAKQAVLSHLGYVKRYPAVYGGQGARQMYDQAWR
jgi:hypothetical protein